MAMLSNGAVITWGTNKYNELGAGEGALDDPHNVIIGENLANQAALDVRLVNTSAGQQDGIYKPGYVVGLEGDYTFQDANGVPNIVLGKDGTAIVDGTPNGEHMVAISSGSAHNMALSGDQSVWTWGETRDGRLGLTIEDPQANQNGSLAQQVYATEWEQQDDESYKMVQRKDGEGNLVPIRAQSVAAGGAFSTISTVEQGVAPTQAASLMSYRPASQDNSLYGLVYAYGDNTSGQIGVGRQYSLAELYMTWLPRQVLGADPTITPKDVVVPEGGHTAMFADFSKMWMANPQYMATEAVDWTLRDQLDEDGVPATSDRAKFDPNMNAHTEVLGLSAGTAIVVATDTTSGISTETTLRVLSRDDLRAAEIFAENEHAANPGYETLITSGYLALGEFAFRTIITGKDALGNDTYTVVAMPGVIPDALKNAVGTVSSDKLRNAVVAYVTPRLDENGNIVRDASGKKLAHIRVVLQVNNDTLALWTDDGAGSYTGRDADQTIEATRDYIDTGKTDANGNRIYAYNWVAQDATIPAELVTILNDLYNNHLNDFEDQWGQKTPMPSYALFEDVPYEDVEEMYLRLTNTDAADAFEGWTKLIVVERKTATVLDAVTVGNKTAATDDVGYHNAGYPSGDMAATAANTKANAVSSGLANGNGMPVDINAVYDLSDPNAIDAMKYPAGKADNRYVILPDAVEASGVKQDNELYVYGALDAVDLINVNGQNVNADHLAMSKGASVELAKADNALATLDDYIAVMDVALPKLQALAATQAAILPDLEGKFWTDNNGPANTIASIYDAICYQVDTNLKGGDILPDGSVVGESNMVKVINDAILWYDVMSGQNFTALYAVTTTSTYNNAKTNLGNLINAVAATRKAAMDALADVGVVLTDNKGQVLTEYQLGRDTLSPEMDKAARNLCDASGVFEYGGDNATATQCADRMLRVYNGSLADRPAIAADAADAKTAADEVYSMVHSGNLDTQYVVVKGDAQEHHVTIKATAETYTVS
ncbi:MAG: hypothetical protein NC311_20480, partial [Muribaculaceae bacterium]|nr:hypothetical protein [Muribaculaceae bacterium]